VSPPADRRGFYSLKWRTLSKALLISRDATKTELPLSVEYWTAVLSQILPPDAMLARYMPWPCVCVCVCSCLCLSVTSPSSTKTAQWTDLIFGTQASFDPSYTVL